MNNKFKISISLSLLLHAAVLCSILFFGLLDVDRAAGDREYVVVVEVAGGEGSETVSPVIMRRRPKDPVSTLDSSPSVQNDKNKPVIARSREATKQSPANMNMESEIATRPSVARNDSESSTPSPDQAEQSLGPPGPSTSGELPWRAGTPGPSTSGELPWRAGTPGDGGTNKILSKIKAKIERSKLYPRVAMKQGIEGRSEVRFQINSDGSIKFVELKRSSGQQIIDDAAIETVKRAAPLPYYEHPIQLAIKYELR